MQRPVGSFEGFHVREPAAEEDRRGDHEHRHVDEAGDDHCDENVDARVPVEGLRLVVVPGNDPMLCQRRVQVDDMRHHCGAEDPDREQNGLVALELRQDRMLRDLTQGRMHDPDLAEVTDPDHRDEGGDHRLERAEAVPLEPEDQERDHAGDHRGWEERNAEQQLDPDRRAEELGQVGRHRDQLRLYPEADRGAAREALPADLRQVPSGCDPELRRQRLDQHRHQVRRDDHPEERESELGSAGDVRGEVARIHVGHAGDEGRAQEGEDAPARAALEHALARPGQAWALLSAGRQAITSSAATSSATSARPATRRARTCTSRCVSTDSPSTRSDISRRP